MNFLYNSTGNPVACEVNGLLFAPSGRNIGRFIKKAGVYADQDGRYLGEVICVNRLVYNRCSKYLSVNLGTAKGQGYIGATVSLKKYSPILLPAGYEDLQPTG